MITHLHPELLALGLALGAALAAVGWRRPSRRFLVVPLAVGAAIAVDARSLAFVPVVAALLLVCLVVTRFIGVGHGAVRPLLWIPLLALPVVAALYLSVPDTEGTVVLAGVLVPIAVVARAGHWRGPVATITCWCLALLAGLAEVTRVGAADRFSADGWWAVKVALLVVEVVLVVIAARAFRSSAPVRPPP